MKGFQTPKKEHSLPADLTNRRSKDSKKAPKVAKKSLDAVFKSVSEDVPTQKIKETADFSPASEISDAFADTDISESFALSLESALSVSSESCVSDLTSTSAITSRKNALSDVSLDHYQLEELEASKIGSVEVDIAVNHLKEARRQVLISADADARSKKLLDALIRSVIDDFCKMPEERDMCTELFSRKTHLVSACLLIWILSVVAVIFFSSRPQNSFSGPLPT